MATHKNDDGRGGADRLDEEDRFDRAERARKEREDEVADLYKLPVLFLLPNRLFPWMTSLFSSVKHQSWMISRVREVEIVMPFGGRS